jgi:hypothetical protein
MSAGVGIVGRIKKPALGGAALAETKRKYSVHWGELKVSLDALGNIKGRYTA